MGLFGNKEDKIVYKEKLKTYELWKLWLSRILIWAFIAITMFPVLAILTASMAPGDNFTQTTIFPETWTLTNYIKVLTKTDFKIWLRNTVLIAATVSVLQVMINLPAAYAFARIKFFGRKYGLMTLLLLQIFPNVMAIPAIIQMAYKLNGVDNFGILILFYCGASAFNIWLLKGFIDGIPKELDEAAMVDGASTWRIFTTIIIPLTRSMLLVIFIFSFVGNYSEFILASALLKNPEKQTLALGLKNFILNAFAAKWPQFAAASIMGSAPVVIIFMLLQKYVASGLVAGGVKE